MQRIPILFIIHSLGQGGTERQVALLARRLNRQRFEPHVATVQRGFRADELSREGIPVFSIPIQSFWNPGPIALSGFLARYIREHGIRLVHVFDAGMSLLGVLAAKRAGVRVLTSQRSHMELVEPQHRWMLLAAHWLADAVVVNSKVLQDYMHRKYRLPRSKFQVCYNGLDTDFFSRQERRKLPPVQDADVVIGSVCVLRPIKNLGHLLKAFARVCSHAPGAHLLLMGSGPEESNLRRMARELGIAGGCHFLPSGPDVRAALGSIDIFVNTSFSEGLSNAVMEAMASECCVIATQVGGCPELIEHHIHGLLVEPTDLEDLVTQMNTAIHQEQLRLQMAAAGAARMRQEFSMAQSAARMTSIYEHCLQSR